MARPKGSKVVNGKVVMPRLARASVNSIDVDNMILMSPMVRIAREIDLLEARLASMKMAIGFFEDDRE